MSEAEKYRPGGVEEGQNYPSGGMVIERLTPEELRERYGIELRYEQEIEGAMERARQDRQRRQQLPKEQRQTMVEAAYQRGRTQRMEERLKKRRQRKMAITAVFLGAAIVIGGVGIYSIQGEGKVTQIEANGEILVETTIGKIEQNPAVAEAETEQQSSVTESGSIPQESSSTISSPNNFSEEKPELPDYSMLDADLQYSIETDERFLGRAQETLALIEKYDDWDAAEAMAIAVAEDRTLDPRAQNTANDNGSTDSGLFQINSIHGFSAEELFNPTFNVDVAHNIWLATGWSAWSTHKSGTDQRFTNFYGYLKQL